MSDKKFSELPPLQNLTSGDIFAVVDDEGQLTSKKVSANAVSKFMFSQSVLQDDANLNNIVGALNSNINPSGDNQTFVSNGVKAGEIYFNGNYVDFTDVFNYETLVQIGGAPDALTSNNQLENEMRFAGTTLVNGQTKLVVRNVDDGPATGAQPISAQFTINADMIDNGSTNTFFSVETVQSELDLAFEGLFNKYSASFDGGNVKDSVSSIPATLNAIQGTDQSRSITVVGNDSLFIKDDRDRAVLEIGNIIRVYGAERQDKTSVATSTNTPNITNLSPSDSFLHSGLGTLPADANKVVTFQYKFARFDLQSGFIGKRTPTSGGQNTVQFSASNAQGAVVANRTEVLQSFNEDRFIKMDISLSGSSNQGVLVYRKNVGVDSEYKLISVLGPKDISTTFKDYYTFDYVSWSGKDPSDNTYLLQDPQGQRVTEHFPVSFSDNDDNNSLFRGWADVTIASITTRQEGGYLVSFSAQDIVFTNPAAGHKQGLDCTFYQNNTLPIQNAIGQKVDIGSKSLSLNAKSYNVTNVSIPNNFGVVGVPGITELKKLPWSGYRSLDTVDQDNSVIRAGSFQAPESVSIQGVKFDGRSVNQYLLEDQNGTDQDVNSLANFGIGSVDLIVENCIFRNSVGAGVYASSPTDLKFTNSEVSNGGLTDRYETFYPMLVDGGTNTMVTNNVFRNFTSALDATVTRQGSIISNNVVRNCGAGLDIFGSTFIVSSPNVLVGPANEFLQSPDVLNSQYDSINILRSDISAQSQGQGQFYTSDPLVYQENGATFDLTQTSISGGLSEIKYRTRLLLAYNEESLGDGSLKTIGSEETYGENIGPAILDANAKPTVVYADENNKSIASQQPANGKLITGETYEIIEVGDVDWTKCGAPINKVGTTFTFNKSTTDNLYQNKLVGKSVSDANDRNGLSTTVPTSGICSRKQFEGYTTDGGTKLSSIYLTNATDNSNVITSEGGFQFQIKNNDSVYGTHNTLTSLTSGSYTRGALTTLFNNRRKASLTDTTAGKIHESNTFHTGVYWSASYRNSVKAADMSNYGTWQNVSNYNVNGKDNESTSRNVNLTEDNDPMNAYRYYRDFECQIAAGSNHLNVGRYVTIDTPVSGFYGDKLFTEYGMVMAVDTTNTPNTVRVRFFGTKYNDNNSGTDNDAPSNQAVGTEGAFGTINIVDDFVLAQGIIK